MTPLNWDRLIAMLKFSINQIQHGESKPHKYQVHATEVGFDSGDFLEHMLVFTSPIKVEVEISRMQKSVSVTGEISVDIEVECRRCGEPFRTKITADLDVKFFPERKIGTVDPFLETYGERYYVGNEIDLAEDIRQAILLEIPTWPVSNEPCDLQSLSAKTLLAGNIRETESPFAKLATLNLRD